MLDKLKALVTGQAIPDSLTEIFKELEKKDANLAGVLTAYVAHGSDPATLMSLSSSEKKVFYETCVRWGSINALKKAVTSNGLTPEQWFRLGQLYDDSRPPGNGKNYPACVPQWFAALQECRDRSAENDRKAVWNIPLLHTLLDLDQIPAEAQDLIILSTFFAVSMRRTYRPKFDRDHPVMAAFITDHLELVGTALNQVDLDSKLKVLTWLAQAPAHVQAALTPTLISFSTNSSKQLREASLVSIEALPEPDRSLALAQGLEQGTGATVGGVIDRLVRIGEVGRTVLEKALAQGKGGKRDELIRAAIERSHTLGQVEEVELEVPPMGPLDLTPVGDDFVAALEKALTSWVDSVTRNNDKPAEWLKKKVAKVQALKHGDYVAMRDYVNRTTDLPPKAKECINTKVLQGLKLTLVQAIRLSMRQVDDPWINQYDLRELIDPDQDLRQLAEAAQMAGLKDSLTWAGQLPFSWYFGVKRFSAEHLWPFYAEHPEQLDEALGLAPSTEYSSSSGRPVDKALEVVATFPKLPQRYIPVLAELATGEAKTNRREAQEMLEKQPNCLEIAQQALGSSKSEMRAEAAAWLGRLGDSAAIPLLRAALAKEKRENPQASMLSALQRLGDDISDDLSPDKLLAQASKGLKSGIPAGLNWFPIDALPTSRWADGSPVDPSILRWWIVVADKLKDPVGAGLIPIYVSLLDQPSQEALGTFVLDSWLAHDTEHPSDEECRAYAEAQADARYNRYQDYAKRYKGDYYAAKAALTRDQVFEELRREKSREYLGSAISNKGLLALTCGTPGHHVLQASQHYIRDHGQRRSQVEALVIAASTNDDPSAIQFVLSVARKFKQESVRAKAMELSEHIAERRGWSLDELADRTIPTAGFDEDGALTLDYGPRSFVGRVARSPKTGAFTIDLFTAEGRAIKALPKPGASDDEELASQARKQLTASKKELTQVAKLQESRLFEAMCLGRTWDTASWQEYLAGHPIMRPLVATLVWQTWDEPNDGSGSPAGGSYRLLRPTPEGELLDADDETVELSPKGVIGLAHWATTTPEEAAAWRQHVADYEVEPLFSQFTGSAPAISAEADTINDHRGWLSDSFAIRGRATKRGYSRGQAEDGGWFDEYYKDLPGAGIRVILDFTGSFLPEEQIAAAITELSFLRGSKKMVLTEVPPILLAESYADYVFVAEAGAFDPDWEQKSAY